jgi:hypothetical protein
MNHSDPDFYMGSSDSVTCEEPRRCWRIQRLSAAHRSDDLLVIEVAPAIKLFGSETQLEIVIVATHFEGDSLFPINTFPDRPTPVYVCRLLIDDGERSRRSHIEAYEYELIAWAELYPSEAEARSKLTYAQARRSGRKIEL